MASDIIIAIDLHHVVEAVCRTLLHSLWLGIVAAVLAGLVIACTVKSKPAVRYNWLLAICAAFVLATIVCFIKTYNVNSVVNNLSTISAGSGGAFFYPIEPSVSMTATVEASWQTIVRFIDSYANIVVLCWLVVFLWKVSRLVAGFNGLHQCRKVHTQTPDKQWVDRVQVLAIQLDINKIIHVLESGLVKIPCTIGYFKPVILVPLGMFTQLHPAQVETILLHELAHIKRKDFISNILLEGVEAVFFFNPAIHWLLSIIRQEREVCCDAMVTGYNGEAKHYMEALVSFQEQFSEAAYAMPLTGRDSSLFDRIKTMISKKNKNLTSMEKVLLSLSIVSVVSLAFVPAGFNSTLSSKAAKLAHFAATANSSSVIYKVSEAEAALTVSKPVKETTVGFTAPKKALIGIDTTKQPIDTIESVRTYMIASPVKRVDYYEIKVTSGNQYKIGIEKGQVVSFNRNGIERAVEEAAAFNSLVKEVAERTALAEEQRKKAEEERHHAEQIRREARTMEVRAGQERKNMEEERVQIEKKRKEIEGQRVVIEEQRAKIEQERQRIEQQRKEMEKQHQLSMERRQKEFKVRDSITSIHKQHVRDIINLLVQSGIVKNAASVEWFALTNTAFIVNGQTQDEAMHQRLLKNYELRSNFGLYYGDVPGNAIGYFFGKHEIGLSK